MRESDNIQELLALKPDYMGFIFYDKSPRYAAAVLDEELLRSFPSSTKKVGVFVNEEIAEVAKTVLKYKLDLVQLHGDESIDYVSSIKELGISVIKVFAMHKGFDFNQLSFFTPFVDFFLFDTKGKERGGTGQKFDWDLLKKYAEKIPYFLSGGISSENVNELDGLRVPGMAGLDVNSKFEISPCYKDVNKLFGFKNALNGKDD